MGSPICTYIAAYNECLTLRRGLVDEVEYKGLSKLRYVGYYTDYTSLGLF